MTAGGIDVKTPGKRLVKVGGWILVVLLLAAFVWSRWPGGDYTVKLVMTSATQLVYGSPVLVNGFEAGNVTGIEVRNGKAVVTVGLDDTHAPLRDGTTGHIEWSSTLGERFLTLDPGPAENPEMPDGAMFEAEISQVEVDEVLAALDEPTRVELSSLIAQLDSTVDGSQDDLNATLRSAGPAVGALGEVLGAVGRDGEAIKQVVTQLRDLVETATERQEAVRGTVEGLTTFSSTVAAQQQALSDSLAELPSTLHTADGTLKKVPEAGASATELLQDLQPGTAQLTETARNLSPVLQDLRPAVGRLRPTLEAAQALLGRTPGLLDTVHGTFPQATETLEAYQPAVGFLRPYTPELVGWFYNWGMNFSIYDSQGHLWAAILGNVGPLANNESLVTPPPIEKESEPVPGSAVGQPWDGAHDATGSPIG
ncbi:MlaD family protein [Pseudonocardia pini]|uniref:MlaD family protein n=1 Tax=Pseudonocardia pini TaxID=2758030 RepID=UPI0028AB2BF5|nr:MlaD family protein [Pseudonocardia pini]